MSSAKQFESVMRAWFEVFMNRSNEEFVRFLKRNELNFAQYGVLMRLHHHADCAVSDLSKPFGITMPGASQLVDKLVQEGLVERTESMHDRRMKQLELTSHGRALVRASLDARLDWTHKLSAALAPERRENIVQAISDLVAAAQDLEEPLPEARTANESHVERSKPAR
jgi:DNA-binding MarR family transcriptional regulator